MSLHVVLDSTFEEENATVHPFLPSDVLFEFDTETLVFCINAMFQVQKLFIHLISIQLLRVAVDLLDLLEVAFELGFYAHDVLVQLLIHGVEFVVLIGVLVEFLLGNVARR